MEPEKKKKIAAGVLLGLFAAGAVFVYTTTSSGRPGRISDVATYEAECQKWVAKEFSASGEATLTRSKVQDGVYVFDFFAPDKPGSSQGKSVLCLADPETGMLSRPGAFEQTKWY